MRWRGLFLASLGVNVALAAGWYVFAHRHVPPRIEAQVAPEAPQVKTNVVIRRQYFSWAEVESPDYPTYIANLRAIGCPEQTIRDIIIAEVNALYSRKLATEVITPAQQWWRSQPDPKVVQAAARRIRALEEQRRELLTRLLGPSWESGDLANLPRPSRPGVALDGPVLGVMPAETKQAVEGVSARAQERLQAYLDAQRDAGKSADPVELAKLRQQTRNELAGLLSPQQLEEYLLRYSQEANNLRSDLGTLKYFNASPDEFRNLFRATDPIDEKIALLGNGTDPNTVAARNGLIQQRDDAIKRALGKDRYQQYVLLHDPLYQDAVAAANDAGTPEAAKTLYQINLAASQQQAAIQADTNLTAQQHAIQLKQLDLDKAKANALATGEELPPDPDAVTPSNPPPPTVTIRSHPYVIGVGQSAASIATLYGVTIDAIRAANPGVNLRRLRPGDTIRVPDSLGQ